MAPAGRRFQAATGRIFKEHLEGGGNMHTLRGRALFFVPALALLAVFVVYPVVNTVWLSFFTSEGEFALLENYAEVLSQPEM